jgi:HK97 family phage prohead protease
MYQVKSNYELKDIDEKQGVISAYVSIFGNVDAGNDITMPGAFSKTLKERGPQAQRPRIKHLWMHDIHQIIGIPEEITEDAKGLLVRSKFGSDAFSQDKFKQHVDGLVTEFSYGYDIVKDNVKSDPEYGEVRELTELKLWEYSSVTWGMNELTHIVEAKGTGESALSIINDRMDKLTKALRKGKYTDETAEQFEIELKQIQTIYNEIIKGKEPEESTHRKPGDEPTLTDEEVINLIKNFK